MPGHWSWGLQPRAPNLLRVWTRGPSVTKQVPPRAAYDDPRLVTVGAKVVLTPRVSCGLTFGPEWDHDTGPGGVLQPDQLPRCCRADARGTARTHDRSHPNHPVRKPGPGDGRRCRRP